MKSRFWVHFFLWQTGDGVLFALYPPLQFRWVEIWECHTPYGIYLPVVTLLAAQAASPGMAPAVQCLDRWAQEWHEEQGPALVAHPAVNPSTRCPSYTGILMGMLSLWLLSSTASHQVMPEKHGKCVCMPSHVAVFSPRSNDSLQSSNPSL